MPKNYYVLTSWIVSLLAAQFLKPFSYMLKTGEWNIRHVLDSGGLPSSHSSSTVGLALSIGFLEGFDSTIFILALAFSVVTMYDAANVRYEAGRNNKRVSDLLSDLISKGLVNSKNFETNLKEVLGHTWTEVIAGMILGIIISLVFKGIFGV